MRIGRLNIDYEKDLITDGGTVLGSFSGFKEMALDQYPDLVKSHTLKNKLKKKGDGLEVHRIVNWPSVLIELQDIL